MKQVVALFLGLFAAQLLSAHDHIEVGVDPTDPTRLGLSGPRNQLALYVPPGEPFSGYLPHFPGGTHASELTFNAEGNTIEFAEGALPIIEIVSVDGPAGGHFSFWEADSVEPVWTLPVGWSAEIEESPTIVVYQFPNGFGHIHGRAFSFNQPGGYRITFRALDETETFAPSLPMTVTFNAQQPPQLSISIENDTVFLTFTSRLNLNYDLQVSATLASDSWTTIEEWIEGTGETHSLSDPIGTRTRAFYRLVEFQ